MKEIAKPASVTPVQEKKPFFKKEGEQDRNDVERPFFFDAVQPKSQVGASDEPLEKEADQVADRVVQHSGLSEFPKIKSVEEPMQMKDSAPAMQLKRIDGSPKEQHPVPDSLKTNSSQGVPLESNLREEMEDKMGADLSHVRLHTGQEARKMNEEMNAHAFAYGNDIFFNEGKYNLDTTEGKHLLAHELTHTLQQRAGVGTKMIQQKSKGKGKNIEPVLDQSGTPETIVFPEIKLPAFKNLSKEVIGSEVVRPANYKRSEAYEIREGDDTDDRKKPQTKLWIESVRPKVQKIVEDRTLDKNAVSKPVNGKTIYFFKLPFGKGKSQYFFGTVEELTEQAVIPKWTRNGMATAFDVDHIKELQLGGQNVIGNIELVQFSLNRSSGSAIANFINSLIEEVAERKTIRIKDSDSEVDLSGNASSLKKKYNLRFPKINYNLGAYKADKNMRWTANEIQSGIHLAKMKPADDLEDINGKPGKEIIYTSETGGKPMSISRLEKLAKKGDSIQLKKGAIKEHLSASANEEIGIVEAKFGSYGSKLQPKDINIPVFKMDGVIHGGGIKRKGQKGKGGLEQLLVGFNLMGMSPIVIDFADLDDKKGLYAYGRVIPSLDIIKGIEVDFYFDKDEILLSKTLTSSDLAQVFPKPFILNSAAVVLSMGNKGVRIKGDIFFEITNVGTGKISGSGKDDGNFGIQGVFNFDKKLFKGKIAGAGVLVAYSNETGWRIEGDLEFQKDSVKGIKSGNIHIAYEEGILKAEGAAEPSIKGVKDVSLSMVFGKDILEIEGGLKIDNLPGVNSGEGKLKIVKKGEAYDFSGIGKLKPNIPGISADIDFGFVNDVFMADAMLHYQRDRLKGNLRLGITNQEVADNKITGNKSENWTVFGGGGLTLMIGEVEAGANVMFLPNGEVEVHGRIGLPKRFKLFPAPMPYQKRELIKLPLDVPTPIPVIRLYVIGYVLAEGEIGGGYLDDVFAEVFYNPARPEEMKIIGSMAFYMPAYAQIRAGVEFGVKASLLIASIRGGIDLSALLRLEVPQPILRGALVWSPVNGFELSGDARVGILPVMLFEGAFKITGEIDLLLGSLSKSWSWPFASLSLRPDTPFGMHFPFRYNKNTPFNLSINQIVFTYPSVGQFANGLKEAVVNEIDRKLD